MTVGGIRTAVSIPFFDAGVSIQKPSPKQAIIRTDFGLKVTLGKIEHTDMSSALVHMSSALAIATIEKVYGICGRHNYIPGDDFTTNYKYHIYSNRTPGVLFFQTAVTWGSIGGGVLCFQTY